MLKIEDDGVTHINVYSKGKTTLGKFLSNFTHTKLHLPEGTFNSVEAYWYWLKCEGNERRDDLKRLHGFSAKKLGKELSKDFSDPVESTEFIEKIKFALKEKLKSNKDVLIEFGNSSLPFVHYYEFGGKITLVDKHLWLIEELECLRTITKNWLQRK